MTEISEKTIGDIDHRVCEPSQPGAELDARLRDTKAADEPGTMFGRQMRIGSAQHGKPKISVTDRARYPHEVVDKSSAAPDFHSCRNLSDCGQGQRGRTVSRYRITAQKTDMEPPLILRETSGECSDPVCAVHRGKRRRQKVVERSRAHCCEIR